MTITDKMFGLEAAKAIWNQKDRSTVHIRRGYLVLIHDLREASPETGLGEVRSVLIKETIYGPYVRVSFWPFLGYGVWIKSDGILQRAEPTYWSSLVNFLRRALKHRVK